MMKYNEQKGNLFELDNDKYFYAHCISADYELGAGIAVTFQKKFHLKQHLKEIGKGNYPELIVIDHVLNLVTKRDRLQWSKVREIIKEEFKDLDIEIEVRYL